VNTSSRFALYFSTFFFTNGLMLAFWPVWLKDRGLDAAAIGTLLFAAQWIKVGGTLAGGDFADRYGIARRVVIGFSLAGVAAMALFGLAQTYWWLLALTLLWGAAWPGILPIVDGQAMQASARGDLDYGRTRLWGSVTFIAATIGGGYLLQARGSDAVHILILAATVMTAAMAFLLPLSGVRHDATTMRSSALLALLRDRGFCLFLVAGGAAQVSHAVYYGFGTLDWRAKGLDDGAIGLLWAMGVVAEIGLFALGRNLAERIGIIRLLLIAGVAAALRWTITPFIDDFLPLLAIQALHALTFGATHLAAMMFIQRRVPASATSSAQALYAAVPIGLGMGLAMMGAGLIYERVGGYAYLAMVGLALISLLATALLARQHDRPVLL
jgi:PPP family 3-phenylpropionic acid transporter